MDILLRKHYSSIINNISDKLSLVFTPVILCPYGLHAFIQTIGINDGITLNYNEEGKLHSKYLGDRYEPAIIIRRTYRSIYYYLFDGEIKDCIHPFQIEEYQYHANRIFYNVFYYSSELIEQKLPIKIYEYHKFVRKVYYQVEMHDDDYDYVRQDYTLHDCMEPVFKFTD